MGVLCFIAIVADSKSLHRLFFFTNKGKGEKNRKDLLGIFLSSGGRLWKGKVLAPFPSVVAYGLLATTSLLKILFCVSIFEDILERRLSAANFVMILVSLIMYTKCFCL